MAKSPLAFIRELRAAILAAEPPYEEPYLYMNIDRPLTPLEYKAEPGSVPSRMQVLRHALFLLDETEKGISTADSDVPDAIFEGLTTVMVVAGMLSAQGIDALDAAA